MLGNVQTLAPTKAGGPQLKPGQERVDNENPPPRVELNPFDEALGLLRKLVEQTARVESDQPTFRIWEFDLTAGTGGRVIMDTFFTRWIIWARLTATPAADYCRISQTDSVPANGAVDLNSGKTAILPAASRILSVLNAGAGALHVSIVADSGGMFAVL